MAYGKEEYDFRNLEKKVDVLIKLVGIGITSGKQLKEKAKMLSSAGFKPSEIAKLLNTSPNSIRVTLSLYKKKRK